MTTLGDDPDCIVLARAASKEPGWRRGRKIVIEDWKRALADLGGRSVSGKTPFATMAQLKDHFDKYKEGGHQMRPLVGKPHS